MYYYFLLHKKLFGACYITNNIWSSVHMCQLREYMLYHMSLHVGEMYCEGGVIFHIVKVELLWSLLWPALMFLSISIGNKIQVFLNKKSTL